MHLLLDGGVVHNSRKAVDAAKKQFVAIGKGGTIAVFGYIQSTVHAIYFQHGAIGRQFYQSAVGGGPYLARCTFGKSMYGVVRQSVGSAQSATLTLFVANKDTHAGAYPQVVAHSLQGKHIVDAGIFGGVVGGNMFQLPVLKGEESFASVAEPPAPLLVASQTEEVVRRAFVAIHRIASHVGQSRLSVLNGDAGFDDSRSQGGHP